jgi:formylmethanofuran dehydrogenase subunit E
MIYPKFFDEIEKIKMQDDLAYFLGATKDGVVEFSYIDLVKCAGHSCPTVLGAYLMTLEGLKFLYKNEIPKRGDMKVSFSETAGEGVSGVIANVITNITGATTNTGFKGINGNFNRNNLMFFEEDIDSSVRFTRLDTNETVDVFYNTNKIPANPKMKELMQKNLMNEASKEEQEEFRNLWQERVEHISKNIKEFISLR